MVSFGIIGGGAGGTATFIRLIRTLAHNNTSKFSNKGSSSEQHSVVWWERSEEFGPGLAWGSGNSDVQLFNLGV